MRLHFVEADYDGQGQQIYSVLVNGQPTIENLDIFAAVGKQNAALVKELPVTADATANLTTAFTGSAKPNASASTPTKAPAVKPEEIMSEDYVSSLAFGPDGNLYVGHWISGLECYSPIDKHYDQCVTTSGAGTKVDLSLFTELVNKASWLRSKKHPNFDASPNPLSEAAVLKFTNEAFVWDNVMGTPAPPTSN